MRYKIFCTEKFYILEGSLPFRPDERFLRAVNRSLQKFHIQQLTEASGELLDQYMEYADKVQKKDVKEWLSDGHICYLALNSKKIAGSVWLSPKFYPYPHRKKINSLFKDSAYISNIFVSSEFRGKPIAAALVFEVLKTGFKFGFTRATAIVYSWNTRTIRFLDKFGLRITNKASSLKVGLFKRIVLKKYQ